MQIWARALVYARAHGHAFVQPGWAQLHLGSWIRWERDKRVYAGLFRDRPDLPGESQVTALARYCEADAAQFEAASGDSVLCFEGIGTGFAPLIGHRELLWSELLSTACSDLEALRESARERVGFGIRLGDFKILGWQTPVKWFEERLRELRAIAPGQNVWVFSDGSDKELASLLADPLVERAPESHGILGSSALATMARMSGTKAMVVAGRSSFHKWGVYLGAVPVVAHATESSDESGWRRLSTIAAVNSGSQPVELSTWERLLDVR